MARSSHPSLTASYVAYMMWRYFYKSHPDNEFRQTDNNVSFPVLLKYLRLQYAASTIFLVLTYTNRYLGNLMGHYHLCISLYLHRNTSERLLHISGLRLGAGHRSPHLLPPALPLAPRCLRYN